MARRPSSGTLIHCEYCGEDFSSTYKRCPFCGERPTGDGPAGDVRRQRVREEAPPEDDYVFEGGDVFDEPYDEEEGAEEIVDRSRGGKRLSGSGSPGPVNWTRTITFICSLVIIAAALVIVFAYLYPKIHTAEKTPPSESVPPSVSQPAVPSDSPPIESSELTPPPVESDPAVPSDEPTPPPAEMVLGITLSKTGFTLKPDESYTIVATVDPASWSGEVTWSTTEPKLTSLEDKGMVTDPSGKTTYQCTVKNVNSGKDVLRATISVTAGDKTVETTVYCRPGSEPDTSSGGGLAPGATGSITGVSSGLRVRSGPGTSYDKVGSLRNGASVTIVSDAGGGWYEIKYDGGKGYIQGEYISVG